MKQQSLNLKFQEHIYLQDMQACSFFEEIFARCKNFIDGDGHSMILMGKEDMAKSFFFYALYNHLEKNNNCYFESIKRKSDLSFCEDLNGDIIFLDSYNSIYGSKNGEILLFKLFNESKQKNAKVLFNNSIHDEQIPNLKDLESRMSSSLLINFPILSDEDKKIIILNFLKNRGLILSDQSIDFILSRYSRSLDNLIELYIKLDKISLVEKKNITIPLIKKTIDL
mgnify:FL=1